MPKVSFIQLSGEKYCNDIIYENYIDLFGKLHKIYNNSLKNKDFIIVKMLLDNLELNFEINYPELYDINQDITINIININLLANIEDSYENRTRIRKIINLEYTNEYIIRNINKFVYILNDDIIAKLAIEKYKDLLIYVDPKYRDDKNIVLACLSKYFGNEQLFDYISERLKNDINFIINVVKNNGNIYKFINQEFKKNREIIMYALLNEKSILKFVDDDFKNDKEIILKLIKDNLIIFKYIPIKLKLDKDVLLESIRNNLIDSTIFEYNFYNKIVYKNTDSKKILNIINNDREILFEFIKKDNMVFIHFYKKYNNDIEILQEIIINTPHLISLASNEIKNNRNLILNFSKINSKIFDNYDIHKLYNNDIDIVLEVIKNNPELFKYASYELKTNEEIKLIALKSYLHNAKNDFQTNIIENNNL